MKEICHCRDMFQGDPSKRQQTRERNRAGRIPHGHNQRLSWNADDCLSRTKQAEITRSDDTASNTMQMDLAPDHNSKRHSSSVDGQKCIDNMRRAFASKRKMKLNVVLF